MSEKMRSLISVLLCALLCFGPYLSGAYVFAADNNNSYTAGDIVQFGSYPSDLVTDSDTISGLNGIQKDFSSCNYCSGDGTVGSAAPADIMKFADVIFEGEKYRAVQINGYRPRQTYKSAEAKNSIIDENGFVAGNIYYFKYEAINWIVLDPESGLVLSEKIIDSQPYSEYMYPSGTDIYGTAYWLDENASVKANDYIKTSLHSFLNNDFIITAFNEDERSQISTAHLTNDSINGEYQMYSSAPSDDRVFILSYEEAENSAYGFTDNPAATEKRTAVGTDYSKIQGLQTDEAGTSPWWLRSAGNTARNASFVNYAGFISTGSIEYTDKGIRPAVILSSILPQSSHTVTFDYNGGSGEEISREVAYGEAIGELPRTTADGLIFDGWFSAKEGGIKASAEDTIKSDITLFAQWSSCEHKYTLTDHSESTCTEAGYNTFTCSVCGKTYTEITPMKDHTLIIDPAVQPTCIESGLTEGVHCSVCGTVITAQEETEPDPSNHSDTDNNGICDLCKEIINQNKYDEYIRKKQAAEAAAKVNLRIREPSVSAVNYGHTLVLHAEYSGTIPEGYSIKWEFGGSGFERTEKGNTYSIKSTQNGTGRVTVKLIDPDGVTVKNNSGKDICDSKEIVSKAGFFQKIIYFFKNLFKINMIIDE